MIVVENSPSMQNQGALTVSPRFIKFIKRQMIFFMTKIRRVLNLVGEGLR